MRTYSIAIDYDTMAHYVFDEHGKVHYITSHDIPVEDRMADCVEWIETQGENFA